MATPQTLLAIIRAARPKFRRAHTQAAAGLGATLELWQLLEAPLQEIMLTCCAGTSMTRLRLRCMPSCWRTVISWWPPAKRRTRPTKVSRSRHIVQ